MIVDGKYIPNVSCVSCGNRHPAQMTCEAARNIAELAEINRTLKTIQPVPVNLGPDMNSLLYWVRKLVHAECPGDAAIAIMELTKLERETRQ